VEFEWDERNERHAAAHGVTPSLVIEVADTQPRFFPNSPGAGRSGSHLMIGPDARGRFWTVVLLDVSYERWRPITGWPSTNTEIRLYSMQGEQDNAGEEA